MKANQETKHRDAKGLPLRLSHANTQDASAVRLSHAHTPRLLPSAPQPHPSCEGSAPRLNAPLTHTQFPEGVPPPSTPPPPPPPAPLMSPPAPAQVRPRLFPHMPQDASVRGSLGLPREGSCRSAAVLPSRLPHSPPQSQHSEGVGASRLGLLLLSRGAGVRPRCGAPRAGEAPASHSLDAGKVGNALSSRAFTAFSFSLLTILGGRSVISIQRRDPNTNWLALDHSIVRK